MNCKQCDNKLVDNAKFCNKCGKSVETEKLQDNTEIEKSKVTIIKCGNCNYIGEAESNRSLWAKILAWLCVFFAPIITILYFAFTKKYRCPKCKSTFVGVKDIKGNFVDQKTKVLKIVLIIFVSIFVIGIMSSVILASLNSAREKAGQQLSGDWITYNAISDRFSILLPHSPSFESSNSDTTSGISYEYHSYSAEKTPISFLVAKYIYSESIDISNPDNLLEKLMNGFVSGSETKLTNSSYINYETYRGLDFTAKTTNETIKGRILLIGETPYLLIISYPAGSNVDTDYDKFVSSFEIK